MNVVAKKMTVDEYLPWAEAQEGRWELIDGVPVAMSPERIEHLEIKGAAFLALTQALRRANLPCQALPDGATVRISKTTAFEPDVTVRCGPKLAPRTVEIPDPIIVVEVESPSSAARDHGEKVDGYFSVTSIQHYLVLLPEQQKVVHFQRNRDDMIGRRLIASSILRLDPPGLEVEVKALFGDA